MSPKERDNQVILFEALAGERGESQQRIATVGLHIVSTLLRKNKDYGNSVFEPPLLCPKMEPGVSILVRLSDKIKRLINLMQGHDPEVSEPIDETMDDFIGYSILWKARPPHFISPPPPPKVVSNPTEPATIP